MITQKQLKQRKMGIGGSDAAAVCGVSKYKTPVSVYMEKMSPSQEQEVILPHLLRGQILEPLIREKFSKMCELPIKEITKTIYHENYPFLFAHVDGYIPEQKAIVEIKTANYAMKGEWGESMTDQIPKDYLTQVHHYLNVCNVQKAYVVVAFAREETFSLLQLIIKHLGIEKCSQEDIPLDIQMFEVKRNKNFDHVLENVEKEFWLGHVEKGIPPQWSCIDDLKALFPEVKEEKKVMATEEDKGIIQEIKKHDTIIKEHETKISLLKGKIMAKMEDASELVDEEGMRIAKSQIVLRNMLDSKSLKEKMPDIWRQFIKPLSAKQFIIAR